MRVMQIVADDTRTCPCCGESHAVQECVVQRRVVAPGMVATVPARYFYCANADEFFEDHEMHAWNEVQAATAGAHVQFGFGGVPPFAARAAEQRAAEGPREDEENEREHETKEEV